MHGGRTGYRARGWVLVVGVALLAVLARCSGLAGDSGTPTATDTTATTTTPPTTTDNPPTSTPTTTTEQPDYLPPEDQRHEDFQTVYGFLEDESVRHRLAAFFYNDSMTSYDAPDVINTNEEDVLAVFTQVVEDGHSGLARDEGAAYLSAESETSRETILAHLELVEKDHLTYAELERVGENDRLTESDWDGDGSSNEQVE